MDKKTIRVIISGRVQGVCFRMETERAAEKFGIYGWVRNRRDGTVEALIEGTSDKIDEMLNWCREGPPLAKVTDLKIFEEEYRGEYKDFTIRYTL